MRSELPLRSAYCIFITTLCEGTVPVWYDYSGWPVTYVTEREAQLEVADDLQERLRQFVAGERDFDDAVTIEEFVLPVVVWRDGSVSVEGGPTFGKRS
jgi:hypothetical protein